MPFRERGRLRTGGRTSLMRWYASDHHRCPLIWSDRTNVDSHMSHTATDFSSLTSDNWHSPVCGGLSSTGTDVPVPPQLGLLPRGVTSQTMPWEDSGLASTRCQARKTSLGLISGKLQLLPWVSTGASTEDRWRLQVMCSGSWCLQDHACIWVEG